ncbi:MAG: DUF2089 domain-containing protein [Armatimonadetes bacterium]|nr:DUF2089 domain-containing protein [Armatimonadota bacterium]
MKDLHDIPTNCPVTGGPLYVSELTSAEGGITIHGKFKLPATARLSKEQRDFLEVFLRSRGVISTVEKELNLSYPTVRARLDALLEAMDLTPYKESTRSKPATSEARRKIIDELEQGVITPEEAKARLKGA